MHANTTQSARHTSCCLINFLVLSLSSLDIALRQPTMLFALPARSRRRFFALTGRENRAAPLSVPQARGQSPPSVRRTGASRPPSRGAVRSASCKSARAPLNTGCVGTVNRAPNAASWQGTRTCSARDTGGDGVMTIVGAEEWVLRITMGVLYGKMCKHGHARSVGRMSLTGWDIRRRRCGGARGRA